LLEQKKCKAIVIACNTASAAAYEPLRDQYKGVIPVINVIDPMIEAVIADPEIQRLGIIATKTTVSSGVYQEKLTRRKPELPFSAMATPLLASMIEEGFYDNSITHHKFKFRVVEITKMSEWFPFMFSKAYLFQIEAVETRKIF
jgi:glutamate racemase